MTDVISEVLTWLAGGGLTGLGTYLLGAARSKRKTTAQFNESQTEFREEVLEMVAVEREENEKLRVRCDKLQQELDTLRNDMVKLKTKLLKKETETLSKLAPMKHINISIISEKGKNAPLRSEKIGRNVPCPCGSGKKYKKCCGR